MLENLRNWLAQWYAQRSARLELAHCASFDVERIAHDLGMSAPELRKTMSGDEKLLFARLSELSIDPARLDPAVLRDLLRCCAACDSHALCQHELEDRPVVARWPAYCPNEQTIGALSPPRRH